MNATNCLTVYSLGFFLYPYTRSATTAGETEALSIAAPFAHDHQTHVIAFDRSNIDDPIVRERLERRHYEVRLEQTGQLTRGVGARSATHVVRERFINGVPPGEGSALSRSSTRGWENFDLIPDLSLMTNRATLRSGWQSNTVFTLELIGGSLAGIRDGMETVKKWRWSNGHRQVASALAKYSVDGFQEGYLHLDRKRYDITADTVIVLLNIAGSADEAPFKLYQRGLDHHVAMLGLCEPETCVTLESPLDFDVVDPTDVPPNHEYHKYVKRFVRKAYGLADDDPGPRAEGFPSCGGRKVAV